MCSTDCNDKTTRKRSALDIVERGMDIWLNEQQQNGLEDAHAKMRELDGILTVHAVWIVSFCYRN